MKITNISRSPTLVYPIRKPSGLMLEPGASYEGDFEEGQATAHAADKDRLLVEGHKPGKAKAPAAERDDTALAAERDDLAGKLVSVTTERDALALQLADLGEEPATEDDADDLRKQAIGLGIKVDKRWTDATVQRKIDEKLAE